MHNLSPKYADKPVNSRYKQFFKLKTPIAASSSTGAGPCIMSEAQAASFSPIGLTYWAKTSGAEAMPLGFTARINSCESLTLVELRAPPYPIGP